MPKRKGNADDGEDSDVSLIDVDFEFFDPKPIDFLAIKRLLVQLFQLDSEQLLLDQLTELILSQPLLGTTIKTDGIDSDPYAFLTVLNLNTHRDHPAIKALIAYILEKVTPNPPFHEQLLHLLGPEALSSSSRHTGLLLNERLINMPVQVVPPMYQMLADEIKWANEEGEAYKFDKFLTISRGYRMSVEESEAMNGGGSEDAGPKLKKSKASKASAVEKKMDPKKLHPFHSEDELLAKFASHVIEFEYSHTQPRGPESFGLDVGGRIMLLPAERYEEMVEAMARAYPPPGA